MQSVSVPAAPPGVRTISAAVADGAHQPFRLETLELDEPGYGEILVRIVAAGLCHTDLAARDGEVPLEPPVVLGHEGAGVVEAVGPGVSKVAPGDHVVLTFDSCGACPTCERDEPAYCYDFRALNFSCRRPDGSTGHHRHDRTLRDHRAGDPRSSTTRNHRPHRVSAPDRMLRANMLAVMAQGLTIRGIVEGDSIPDQFIPYLVELHVSGRLPFERLIGFYDFQDINTAIADQAAGKVVKPVLRF